MEEVARLRQVGGSDLDVARALHRAGLGYAAQYRWQDAGRALSEALDLLRRAGAPPENVAQTASELGDVLTWQLKYDDAVALLTEARELYRSCPSEVGEANCIKSLGEIALR